MKIAAILSTILGLLQTVLGWFERKELKNVGRQQEQLDRAGDAMDAVADKDRIHSRVDTDRDYADSVRDRFTRD